MGASLLWATIAVSAPKPPPAPKEPVSHVPQAPAPPSPEAPLVTRAELGKVEAAPVGKTGSGGEKELESESEAEPEASGTKALNPETSAKKPTSDRYKVILVRNPFGLNPPPPPEPPEPEPEPEPDVDIYLTGISTLLGKKRAFLKTDDPKETEKEKKIRYYSLKIGEEQDQIRIVDIDVDAGVVRIAYKGDKQDLNLKEHGIEKKVAKGGGGKPGQPGAAGRKLPPGMKPSTTRTTRPPVKPATTRTALPRPSGAGVARPPSTANRNVYNRSGTRPPAINVPTRAPRGTGAVSPNGSALQLPIRPTRSSSGPLLPPPPKVNVDEQKILMQLQDEVNRAAYEQEGVIFPPLPKVD